jgi:hypothetical protein
MKSVKNQYIALKEGKMTEAQFMRNVRMTLPQYISNVTLFKQAERILMNKGIISEVKINEANTDGLKQMGYSNSDIEDFMDEWKNGGSKLPKKVKDYLDGLYNTRLGQLKTKPLREVKDESVTGYYNQDGKEQYGKFDELDNMNAQEIMAGYVMEKIDNPNIDQKEAVKLVIKNLKTDQFYYTNYKLTGIRGAKPTEFTSDKRKPGFDQAEEVSKKADNLKDTKNAEKVIKEGLEENNVMAIADEIYNELQALGSYNDNDVAKLIATYPKLSDDEKREIEVIIFDRDREEMGEGYKLLPDPSKAKLKEMVRKMMKEMFDGMEPLSRTGLDA